MKNIILILTIILTITPVFAEKIPVIINPAQIITTTHDEIETGDIIRFKTKQDVYKNNKLFIKKDSPVIGIVDYLNENGWGHDNAQIDIKTFKTRDVNDNLLILNSPLYINGFELLKYKSKRFAQFFNYIGTWRGKEVDIKPNDNVRFTIWYE